MILKSALPCTLVLAGLVVTGLSQAADPPVVISTGKNGGGYNTIGERLKTVLAEQVQSAQVLTSVGSVENLKRLEDPKNPVSVILTQADALKSYLKDHPGFAEQFISLGEIGKECVFIIVGKDSDINNDDDLQQAKGRMIAVQSPDSGVAVTWEYMTWLEPAFKKTTAAFVDGAEALLQITSDGKASKIQAVMVVQKPMAKSTEMQVVLKNPESFRLIPVKDWNLNSMLPDGRPVNTFENVTVAEKRLGFDTTVDTICTRGLILASKTKLTADQRTRLARLMLLGASRVVGEDGK